MAEAIDRDGYQDLDLTAELLRDQERLAEKRRPLETVFRELDQFLDPHCTTGFAPKNGSPNADVEAMFDPTGMEGLDRYTAAIGGVSIPRGQRWHGLKFGDSELMKLDNVLAWCEIATDGLFAARYAPNAGFETNAFADIRQEGKYGTSGLWVDMTPTGQLFYSVIPLVEQFIDQNYFGQVDRSHRSYKRSIVDLAKQFGADALHAKVREKLADTRKRHELLDLLFVIRPNQQYEAGRLGWKGKPFEAIYVDTVNRHIIRRGGYYSFPSPTSRVLTSPGDPYGRSPGMKALPSVKGLQSMNRTLLDAGNRAVDPALLFHDDCDVSRIMTMPGGLNPGGLDDMGNQLIKPLHLAGELPYGEAMVERERGVVQKMFLEELFRLLSDPSDRMTATQVMETLQKEGVLIAPFAARRETEKTGPMVVRELDLLIRARKIPPLPPEVIEAGAFPLLEMTNPIARMARAEEVSAFTRSMEIGVQIAGAGAPEVLDNFNLDDGMRNTADVLGVRPSLMRSRDEVAQIRQNREQAKAGQEAAAVAPEAARAALDVAKANEIAAQLGEGGGL